MTEYIKNQLIKLCDNPEWFNDMLNSWYLSRYQVTLKTTQRVHRGNGNPLQN